MREELIKEIMELAKENSFHVERKNDSIVIRSEKDSPVTLVVELHGENEIIVGFQAKDLIDYIEELRDHDENVDEIIESQLDDLKSIAYKIINKFSKKVKVVNKLRETELDIIEELEE